MATKTTKTVTLICDFCKLQFTRKQMRGEDKQINRCCSRACYVNRDGAAAKEHPDWKPLKECEQCGLKTSNSRFCNRACQKAHTATKQTPCKTCKEPCHPKAGFCSKKCYHAWGVGRKAETSEAP